MQLLDQINCRGTTILVSTHDHLLVSQMRKRVIELRAGQIIRDEVEGIYMSS
ncbi:MAG: hypothetical protein R2857_02875 [Vampirovibrionales bacterium]